MWDEISSATGQTVGTYATRKQANEVAAPMEHHGVALDQSSRFGFAHLPRPRFGEPSHVERAVAEFWADQVDALMAHAAEGRPLGHGCRCVACPHEVIRRP